MNRFVFVAATAIAMSIAAAASANMHLIKGKVTKVDSSAQKLTIRHGAIKKFDMDDGMTMVFRVKDPAMLKQVKPGDDIQFNVDRVNGAFTVMEIQKGK